MSVKILLALVLIAVVLVISVAQAIQLSDISNKISPTGYVAASSTSGSAASSNNPSSNPTMVGGC